MFIVATLRKMIYPNLPFKNYKIEEGKIKINNEELNEHTLICWATSNAIFARYFKHEIPSDEVEAAKQTLKQCLSSAVRNQIFKSLYKDYKIEDDKISLLPTRSTYYKMTAENRSLS